MKKIITVPEIGDSRFKQWTKTCDSVDTGKSTGYAFEGKFIRAKAELEVGSFILAFGREGSRSSNLPVVALYKVLETGEVGLVYSRECETEMWALEVRDEIAEYVNTKEDITPSLAGYTLEQLEAEIERRKN